MSEEARSVTEAVERFGHDTTLNTIHLNGKDLTDSELTELVDCLLAQPDVVKRVLLARNQLTDETGVKLARYLAASSTVEWLALSIDQLGLPTYLALAAALRVNSSLRHLYLNNNQAVDRTCIEAAFVEALRLNSHRPAGSLWWMYSPFQDNLPRLRDAANVLGHPSLQLLLAARLECDDRPTGTIRH